MDQTIADILEFVEENDVKFIRLAYCDLFGIQKNMAIMAGQLKKAFEEGIIFDASAVKGFQTVEHSDLFLVPDGSTVTILPWRPSHERVMRICCNVKNPDGTDFEGYSRNILKKAVQRSVDMGYICNIGTECEFYLFKTDEAGEPTTEPFDHGGYNDIAPLDKCENVRREICLAIEEMGLLPESSHHERGPGQNEVDFRYSDALSAADNFITFKMVVKSIAAQNGLYASFLPKPLHQESGNGLHINLSLSQGGKNLFQRGDKHSANAESFIAGILARSAEMAAFLNPLTNSYSRLGSFEAPKYVTWSHQNRSQLIRIPASTEERTRMEMRAADPACNPYLAFALLIHAGLDGIEQKARLLPPDNRNLFEVDDPMLPALPHSLEQALQLAENSSFVHRALPEPIVEKYIAEKKRECASCRSAADRQAFELARYFHTI